MLSVVIIAFKLIGSEGSRTFGSPTLAVTGRIEELCMGIVDTLKPANDNDEVADLQTSSDPLLRMSAAGIELQSQVNFQTQLAANDQSVTMNRRSLLTQDPVHSQENLHESIKQSRSSKCKLPRKVVIERESGARQSISGHDDHDCNNSASLHSQPLPRVHSQSGRDDDELDVESDKSEAEIGQDSHFKAEVEYASVNQLLFIDHFHQEQPFTGMRRVPRKFARISKMQQAQIESDCWYRNNGKDNHMFSNIPEAVKKSLEMFLRSVDQEVGDEEEAEQEDESEANDDYLSKVSNLQTHFKAPSSIRITEFNENTDFYDNTMDGEHEGFEHDLTIDEASEDEQELPWLPPGSQRGSSPPDNSKPTSKHDTLGVTKDTVPLDLELAVPIAMSGFSSDVEFDMLDSTGMSNAKQHIVNNIPSSANTNLIVEVERTPYIPLNKRHGNEIVSDTYGISSDPVIPATIWEIENASQLTRRFNDSRTEDIGGKHGDVPFTNPIGFALSTLDEGPFRSRPHAESMDSSPIKLASDDSLATNKQTSSDMSQPHPTKHVAFIEKHFSPAQHDILPDSVESISNANATDLRDRRPSSKKVRVGEPAWYKRVAAMVAKEKDIPMRNTKLLSSKDRKQFKIEQERTRQLQFQVVMRDPELTPLVQIAGNSPISEMGLSGAPTTLEAAPTSDTHFDVLSSDRCESPSARSTFSANVPGARTSIKIAPSATNIHASELVSKDSIRTQGYAPTESQRVPPSLSSFSSENDSSMAEKSQEPKNVSFSQFPASITHADQTIQHDIASELQSQEEDVRTVVAASTPKTLFPQVRPTLQVRSIDLSAVVKTEEDLDMLNLYDVSPPRLASIVQYPSPYRPVSRADVEEQNVETTEEIGLRNSAKSFEEMAPASNHSTFRSESPSKLNEPEPNYFTKFCNEYPQYTGNQSDFTLALVYIEYLLKNSMFGHSHMCDDFVRFYPEDYLALHGDKLKISGWELFKRRVRRPEFEADVISADNLAEALDSLREKEVARMRSKFAVQDQRLFFGSTVAAASHASSTSTRNTSPVLVEYRQADEISPKDLSPAHEPAAEEEEEELSLFVENNRSPPITRQLDHRSISAPKQAPRQRQPFFETASQQPPKRKASAEVVRTPRKRRTLPWATSKQLTPRTPLSTPRKLSPPTRTPQQDSPILGDPNAIPRTARSSGSHQRNPFISIVKARDSDRRRTLGTATVLEKKSLDGSTMSGSGSVTGSAQKHRKGLKLLSSDPNLFRQFVEKNLEKERNGSWRSSLSGRDSLTPSASPGVSGISLKLKMVPRV